MLKNPELMKMINSDINTKPQIIEDEDDDNNNMRASGVLDGTDAFLKKLQQMEDNDEIGVINDEELENFQGFDSLNDVFNSDPNNKKINRNNDNNDNNSDSTEKQIIDAEFE